MLHVFRESVGRVIAIALLGLIMVTLIFFGIDFTNRTTSYAAKVNGRTIPMREFEDEVQLAQNQFQQENRVEITDDLRKEIRRQVLDEMILREALLVQAEKDGYSFSNERLAAFLRGAEAFQVDGQFSSDVYRARLAQQGLTPALFEARQREQSTSSELQNGIVDSVFLTPAEFRRAIEILYERRELAWAVFAAEDFRDQVTVTDDEIASYFADNGDQFMTPESVDIEYIELSLDDVAKTIQISDADLRKAYDEDKDAYAASEERHASHIQVETEAEAEAVEKRLADGEDFAAVAADVSEDAATKNSGGDLGWIARGSMDSAFEGALYALAGVGDVSPPVKTDFGWHVIKLDELRTTQSVPFEQARDEIQKRLADDQAYTLFADRARKIGLAAYDAVDDLASVAREFDLPLETLDGLTRTGGADDFSDPAPVIQAAFMDEAIEKGENSDLIELGEDHVVVLRVKGHHAPEPEPLKAVSDTIRNTLELKAARQLAMDASSAYVDELDPVKLADGTEDPAALAMAHGGQFNEKQWVERDTAGVPDAVLTVSFSRSRPAPDTVDIFDTPTGSGDQAVILLSAVEPGMPANIPATARDTGQQQLKQDVARAELNAYAADVRARAKIRIPEDVLEVQSY